jgi:site-specific recombinase XerD
MPVTPRMHAAPPGCPKCGRIGPLPRRHTCRDLLTKDHGRPFGHRTGLLHADVARPLHLPKVKNVLAERILEETEVARLIALEPNRRNHALLRLLYLAGLRLSEAAALSWHDLRKRGVGGQVTVFGKGGKTRAVLLHELATNAAKHGALSTQVGKVALTWE